MVEVIKWLNKPTNGVLDLKHGIKFIFNSKVKTLYILFIKVGKMDVFINEPEKPKFPLFKNVPLSDRYTGLIK